VKTRIPLSRAAPRSMESVPVPTREIMRSPGEDSMTLLVKGSVPAMAISAFPRALTRSVSVSRSPDLFVNTGRRWERSSAIAVPPRSKFLMVMATAGFSIEVLR